MIKSRLLLASLVLASAATLPAQDETPAPARREQSERRSRRAEADAEASRTEQSSRQNEAAGREPASTQRGEPAAGEAAPPPAVPEPAAAAPPPPPVPSAPRAAAGSSIGAFVAASKTDSRMLRLQAVGKQGQASINVAVGGEFSTEVIYANKQQMGFDQLRVILSYDAEAMEPVAINDKTIAGNLAGEPTAEFDAQYGLLLYEAQFSEPLTLDEVPLLTIRWKAKRVVMESRIEFSSRGDLFSLVVGEERDLLGSDRVAGDGTLDMMVNVLPADPREAEALLRDPTIYQRTTDKIGGVRLFLQAPAEQIVVGKPFAIDVVLDNRAFSMLDGLGLLLAFDPEVLTILDADHDNWITREVNILDGPFREAYPWDFHIDNLASNVRGLIRYRVGSSDGSLTRGKTGTVARIYAVAKAPTEGTALTFKFSGRTRANATEVVYVGEDVLGDPAVLGDGATGLLLRVLPAPREAATEVAAGQEGSK